MTTASHPIAKSIIGFMLFEVVGSDRTAKTRPPPCVCGCITRFRTERSEKVVKTFEFVPVPAEQSEVDRLLQW